MQWWKSRDQWPFPLRTFVTSWGSRAPWEALRGTGRVDRSQLKAIAVGISDALSLCPHIFVITSQPKYVRMAKERQILCRLLPWVSFVMWSGDYLRDGKDLSDIFENKHVFLRILVLLIRGTHFPGCSYDA